MFGSGYNENAALMPELFDEYSHDELNEVERIKKIQKLRKEYKIDLKKNKKNLK
ncbi:MULTISPECIES: hypothetical protein [unclassified Fusibacter]|uniref:hypothetical protein n=1 Tax=unclassified Fusibacter TaxID=2624464 RepID=UPI0013E97828|nr:MULTISPECIES: hypothetical protein [unclassified Fusibacter]MCK8059998.1 hypothetical protein [Fusibacter sp. A2]NPE22138.1 hypothetical protein [Fusibacter sp. A1]